MKHFLQWLSRPRRAAAARCARPVRLGLERLDERLVPSATSAMTTTHLEGIFASGQVRLLFVQDHDLYAIDQTSGQVVDFHDNGTGSYTRTALGGPTGVQNVSASIAPNTGYAEVFAETRSLQLWRCDSLGHWVELGTGTGTSLYGDISATRDGQVFAVNVHDQHIDFFHANGTVTNLGNPEGLYHTIDGSSGIGDGIAASVDPYRGTDEVFVIGQDGALWVGGSTGGWYLIDNTRLYINVAATPSGGVFANQNGFAIFHWTEGEASFRGFSWTYWTGQQIATGSPSLTFWEMSADTDASGHDEVYVRGSVGYMQFNLYRFDQGSMQQLDTNVSDVAAAGGGYFFDVNPYSFGNYVWAFNPNASDPWIYLGTGVQATVW